MKTLRKIRQPKGIPLPKAGVSVHTEPGTRPHRSAPGRRRLHLQQSNQRHSQPRHLQRPLRITQQQTIQHRPHRRLRRRHHPRQRIHRRRRKQLRQPIRNLRQRRRTVPQLPNLPKPPVRRELQLQRRMRQQQLPPLLSLLRKRFNENRFRFCFHERM